MNKEEIYNLLKESNVWYEITEHIPVYKMEDLEKVDLPYKDRDAKNIFLRDDKKRNFYLLTIVGDKRLDIKEFQNKHYTRNLSFASPELLLSKLNLIPGSVTPFGLLNNKERDVKFYLDSDFKDDEIIGVHPNQNDATVWIKVKDLIKVLNNQNIEVNRL